MFNPVAAALTDRSWPIAACHEGQKTTYCGRWQDPKSAKKYATKTHKLPPQRVPVIIQHRVADLVACTVRG